MTRLLTAIAVLVLATPTQADDAGGAQAMIDKGIKAIGGEKAAQWKSAIVKSKGSANFRPDGGPIPFIREVTIQFPDQMRMTFSIDLGEQKISSTLGFNHDKGWMQMANGSFAPQPKERVADQLEEMYPEWVGTLVPLKDSKTFTLELLPEDKVDGKPAIGVKVSAKGHRDVKLYFDKETSLIVKRVTQNRGGDRRGASGELVEQETFLSDYKESNGVRFPMKVVAKRGGKVFMEELRTEVKFGGKLEDKVFAEP